MYPLKFKPLYKEMPWGGARLSELYNSVIPSKNTGERWDVSLREKEMSVCENGPLAGKTFEEIVNSDREGYLGKKLMNLDKFPLLVKIIDANDNLSIQVHPDDEYAAKNTKDYFGKNEMWYVLYAPENAALIMGLQSGVTKESLRESLGKGDPMDCFTRLPIKQGDVIDIPAGLIHAITKGVMVAEIQQNSDTTYRLFDYNRLGLDGSPRPLHIEDSLNVADFEGKIKIQTVPGLKTESHGTEITYYIANRFFAVEKYDMYGVLEQRSDPDKFIVFTSVDGQFVFKSGGTETPLSESYSLFIPAGLGEFEICGAGTLLKSYVPNVRKDFADPLLKAGYSMKDIYNRTALRHMEDEDA